MTVWQNLLAYEINRDQISFCLLSIFLNLQCGVLTNKRVINGQHSSNLPFFSKNKNIYTLHCTVQCSAKQKIRRKMEVVKIDRGSELNRKRINSIEVDVWFHVQNEIIPAHRLIVALHSDYLKALTNPLSSFVERWDQIIFQTFWNKLLSETFTYWVTLILFYKQHIL